MRHVLFSAATLLAAVLTILPTSASAAPPAWIVHTVSAHTRSGYDGNNFGLAYRWANGAVTGAFHNSYGRTSAYAGWLWSPAEQQRWSIFLGAATGYGDTTESMPIAPIVAPSFSTPLTDASRLRLSWFADPRKGAAQVLHLSFEFQYP
jgi:hypothetical protein